MVRKSWVGRPVRLGYLSSCAAVEVLVGAGLMGVPQAAIAQTASAAAAATPADQQDDNGGDIVVSGVRAAIAKSLETKRNADSIIDTITAEDIGKFPDNNIAEAVQRIPGVAIDRSGGEGRYISINGLGPDFSLTLLNGRQIATSEQGRSFGFDTIASQVVGSVNVYKTANADIPEGGLGGTIDIRTVRPFDYPGLKFSVTGQYLYSENSKKADPQVSALFSDRFLDGRLGVLVSFTHQKRRTRQYTTNTSGAWLKNQFVDPTTFAYFDDTHAEAWRAWNVQYGIVDEERTRNTGTIALQFKATDTLTLTADYLYSKFDVKTNNNTAGAYLWAVQNTPNSVIDSNGSYTKLDVGVGYNISSYSVNSNQSYRPTTTQAAGFNVKWDPVSNFTGNIDIAWSKGVTDNKGLNRNQTLEALNTPGYYVTFPANSAPYFDTNGFDLTKNLSAYRARIVSDSGTYSEGINKQAKADFEYKFTPELKFSFGALYAEQKKSNNFYLTPILAYRLYQANGQSLPIDYQSIISKTITADDKFGLVGHTFPVFIINPGALRAWMADPANIAKLKPDVNGVPGGANAAAFAANGGWTARPTGAGFVVNERDFSAYAELQLDTTLGTMPLNVVAGLRYAQTDVSSDGTMRNLVSIAPDVVPNYFTPVYDAANPVTAASAKNSYRNWLPSINAKLEVFNNFIVRASASRTMSRPTLEDMGPALNIGGISANLRTASGGNPNLRPFVSTNFDASVEYYYSKTGSLAIAGFYKDAKDFVIHLPADEKIPGLTIPASIAALYPGKDLSVFTVDRPRNAKSATIKGITAAWTQSLAMGFGVQLNYTLVRSSATITDAQNFAIPGISDTANAVAFYEKGPISARIAFNWRARFLTNDVGVPGQSQPVYGSAYHQVDARLGFDLGSGFNFGIEAVNLTHEKVRMTAKYSNEFVAYNDYGRQFTVSVTKKF